MRSFLRYHAVALCALLVLASVVPLAGEADVNRPKISVVTALLPTRAPSGAGTNPRIRVEASGGCFQWESKRPHLVRVESADLVEGSSLAYDVAPQRNCESAVIVSSVAEHVSDTEKVVVTARDASTGVELRCEVHVAHVARLEVETRVRRINVDELEILMAKAFDARGNVFTSLEGRAFHWQVNGQDVLRHLSLLDSPFQPSALRRQLEQRGLQSDMVLLRGVNTGRARVSVSLAAAAVGAVEGLPKHSGPPPSAEVELVVAEQLQIVPATVRLPLGGLLLPELRVLRGKRQLGGLERSSGSQLLEVPVPMPSKDFRWRAAVGTSSSEASVATADTNASLLLVSSTSGRTVARSRGTWRLVVEDTRIEDNTDYAMVHVAEPASLRLALRDAPQDGQSSVDALLDEAMQQLGDEDGLSLAQGHLVSAGRKPWWLVRGRPYIVQLQMLDGASRPMRIPVNFRITVQCRSNAGEEVHCPLRFVRQTTNAVALLIDASTVGDGTIIYKWAHIQPEEQDKEFGLSRVEWPMLTVEQSFRVLEPLKLRQPFSGPLVLPVHHAYKLQATGGTGEYLFTLLDDEPQGVCSTSVDGLVRASGIAGSARILAADKRSFANNITLRVMVRYLGALELRPVQSQLQLQPGSVGVPILARPSLAGDDSMRLSEGSSQYQLHFWNCSLLQLTISGSTRHELLVHSTRPAVAHATVAGVPGTSQDGALPSTASGICAIAAVQPRAAGTFTLTAEVHEVRTEIGLRVFSPLRLVTVNREPLSGSQSSVDSIVVALCSSARLQMEDGPSQIDSANPVIRSFNVPNEGTHIRIERVSDKVFDVVCLQPTPGSLRLVAEAKVGTSDGSPLVAQVSVSVTCVSPVMARVLPLHPLAAPISVSVAGSSDHERSLLGVRRGHEHRFRVQLLDADGKEATHTSSYSLQWALAAVGAEQGGSKAEQLLTEDASGLVFEWSVPPDAEPGVEAVLSVEAKAPSAETCGNLTSLRAADQEIVLDSVRRLPSPLRAVLQLRVTLDFTVRWPGYPWPNLPFAPQWAFQLKAINGTGAASASVDVVGDGAVQMVTGEEVCGVAAVGDANMGSGRCYKALQTKQIAEASAKQWFVRPSAPASEVRITVQDEQLLGGAPQVAQLSFLPAARLELSLPGASPVEAGDTHIIVRGQSLKLCVKAWSTKHQLLGPASWSPLQMAVEANDSSIDLVEIDSDDLLEPEGLFQGGCAKYITIVARQVGTFELKAKAYNHPMTALYSETLHVHVFEPFGVAPAHAVLIPTQTFEYTIHGGPVSGAIGQMHTEFSCTSGTVASVTEQTGVLSASSLGSVVVTARLIETMTGIEIARAEAQVDVVRPDTVFIQPPTSTSSELFIQAGASPVQLSAALYGHGLRLTPDLLTAPRGAAVRGSPETRGCTFKWSTSSGVLLSSNMTGPAVGASAVDVWVPLDADIEADSRSTIAVEVACPNSASLRAERQFTVVKQLQLIAPNVGQMTGSSHEINVPLFAAVPLVFTLPLQDLVVDLVGQSPSESDRRQCMTLSSDEYSFVLHTGEKSDASLLLVREKVRRNEAPPLTISIIARMPTSLRLLPAMPAAGSLAIGAMINRRISLLDATGTLLAMPPKLSVVHSVSHPSVLTSELVRSLAGDVWLKVKAVGEGCASVNVRIDIATASSVPDSLHRYHDLKALNGDTQLFCVVRGALVGQRPLIVPGSRLHLSIDGALTRSVDHSSPTVLSLRLRCVPGSEQVIAQQSVGKQLARDIEEFLRLPSNSINAKAVHWASHDEPVVLGCVVAGVDVELEFLQHSESISEAMEKLWHHSSQGRVGRALRLLDFSRGVRMGLNVAGEALTHSLQDEVCGRAAGWSTSGRGLSIDALEEEALALQSGDYHVRLCANGVSSQFDVIVRSVSDVRASSPSGGALLDSGCGRTSGSGAVITNVRSSAPLVIPLRFFSLPDPSSNASELLSGPFVKQGFSFTCEPTNSKLNDFFTFDSWSAYKNVNASEASNFSHDASLLPRGLGEPQSACVLTPKVADALAWREHVPPRAFGLQVSVKHPEVGSPTWPITEWPFVPQFMVVNTTGATFSTGDVCATVSLSEPIVTITVWTGGHPVETSLASQLSDPRRGALSLHVRETGGAGASAPSISITIMWEASTAWGGSEDISLRLESRATCQMELMRIRVDGLDLHASPAVETADMSVGRPGGYVALVLLLLVFSCCIAATKQYMPVTPPVAGLQPGGQFVPTTCMPGPAGLQRPPPTPMRRTTAMGGGGDPRLDGFTTPPGNLVATPARGPANSARGINRGVGPRWDNTSPLFCIYLSWRPHIFAQFTTPASF